MPGLIRGNIPDQQGFPRSVAGTQAAGNAAFTIAVPTNARWKLYQLHLTLVASGVATRTPRVGIDNGTDDADYWLDVDLPTFVDAQTREIYYVRDSPLNETAYTTDRTGTTRGLRRRLPDLGPMLQADRIRVTVLNGLAADTIDGEAKVEEWLEE